MTPNERPSTDSLGPALREASAAFAARLIAHFSSPKFTPPLLPGVALEVHTLAHQSNIDVSRVIAVLEKDPLLAGRVLKVAQSAAYYAVGGISSLRDAVVRIGLRGLSDILWEVAFTMRVLRTSKYAALTDAVIKHSTGCGHLVRMVCSLTGIDSDYGFLCGLLHDAGTTACLSVLGAPPPGERQPPDALVGHILRLCHEEATRILASHWKLPDEVQEVLARHHVVQEGPMPPVLAALVIAELLATELEPRLSLAAIGADVIDEPTCVRARQVLRLNDDRMAKVRAEATKLLASLTAEPVRASSRSAGGSAGARKAPLTARKR